MHSYFPVKSIIYYQSTLNLLEVLDQVGVNIQTTTYKKNICFPILSNKSLIFIVVKREYHGHVLQIFAHRVARIFSKKFWLALCCNICDQALHFCQYLSKNSDISPSHLDEMSHLI